MMVLTVLLLVPQVWVLLHDHSARWCVQPLLQLLIVSIVLTLFLIGKCRPEPVALVGLEGPESEPQL